MSDQSTPKRIEPIRDIEGTFCPEEVVDRVADLFIVRERDGRAVEKQLGIRRPLFERALRHAINRERDPRGPKPMARAGNAHPLVMRRAG